ncbi:amidase [Paenibacillus algorifonticola]|uniref:Amidase n=1 Tax=Paenibacillus algorifonticola TaxID=684063 RepID=A0A1I2GA71_9BACL|nr:amidase family protein [Paenibacillus algorifonticola]SFF13880.1 amidase [Paenibacillus algorifonticola]
MQDKINDTFHAFIKPELTLPATNTGKLDSLRFAVKDVFAIKGHASSAGNPDWLHTHEAAEHTASSIERLLAAGASLTGAAHTDELMYSINGQNAHYGTPINPLAPDRIPGGSSSGSAVAVAAGAVDFALGTDTGGSVRVPAAYCGVYGFRPTHGAVAMDGVIPLAPSFDTVGWMARDSALLLKVGELLLAAGAAAGVEGNAIAAEPDAVGASVRAFGATSESENENAGTAADVTPFSRLLIAEDAWSKAESASELQLRQLVAELEPTMANIEQLTLAPEGLEQWLEAFRTIQGLEIWQTHGEWIKREQPAFGPGIAERFHWSSTLRKEDGEEKAEERHSIRAKLRRLLGTDGLLVIPTIPGTAPDRDISGEAADKQRALTMQLCCIAGLSGLPQVTLPVGEVDGAPIGLSIIAGAGQDLKLLRWIEQHAKLWERSWQPGCGKEGEAAG